ncbi:hypothetical protein ACWD7M_16275 [Streptomyces griseus]
MITTAGRKYLAELDAPGEEKPNHDVVITRAKLYPEVAHAGPAWRWTYNYTVDGGPVCQYGPGLESLRSMLRRKFGTAGREAWKGAAAPVVAPVDALEVRSEGRGTWHVFAVPSGLKVTGYSLPNRKAALAARGAIGAGVPSFPWGAELDAVKTAAREFRTEGGERLLMAVARALAAVPAADPHGWNAGNVRSHDENRRAAAEDRAREERDGFTEVVKLDEIRVGDVISFPYLLHRKPWGWTGLPEIKTGEAGSSLRVWVRGTVTGEGRVMTRHGNNHDEFMDGLRFPLADVSWVDAEGRSGSVGGSPTCDWLFEARRKAVSAPVSAVERPVAPVVPVPAAEPVVAPLGALVDGLAEGAGCTCGGMDHASCLCGISLSDFLATQRRKAVVESDARAGVLARLDAVWSRGYVTSPCMTHEERRVAAEIVADDYTEGGARLVHGRDRAALVEEYRAKDPYDLMNAYGSVRLRTGGDVWALVGRRRSGERVESLARVVEPHVSGEAYGMTVVTERGDGGPSCAVDAGAVVVMLARELSGGGTVERHALGALRVVRESGTRVVLRPVV